MAYFERVTGRRFPGIGHRSTYWWNDLVRENVVITFKGGRMEICTKGLGFSGAVGELRGKLLVVVLEVAISHSVAHCCATSALITRMLSEGVYRFNYLDA